MTSSLSLLDVMRVSVFVSFSAKGYDYFGVQYYGECWSGPEGHETFNINGPSDNCGEDVGKDFALMVYKKITTGENRHAARQAGK